MFKLLKLGVAMVALTAFAWFGVTYKLGSRTLFQHLRAIGQTKESQELVDATRQAAGPLVDDVRRKIAGQPAGQPAGESTAGKPLPPMPADAPAPQERLSPSEQKQLRRLAERAVGH
jgi:hypothetical protein